MLGQAFFFGGYLIFLYEVTWESPGGYWVTHSEISVNHTLTADNATFAYTFDRAGVLRIDNFYTNNTPVTLHIFTDDHGTQLLLTNQTDLRNTTLTTYPIDHRNVTLHIQRETHDAHISCQLYAGSYIPPVDIMRLSFLSFAIFLMGTGFVLILKNLHTLHTLLKPLDAPTLKKQL